MKYTLRKEGPLITVVGLLDSDFPKWCAKCFAVFDANAERCDFADCNAKLTPHYDGFVLDAEHPNGFRNIVDGCFAIRECNSNCKPGDEFWYGGKLIFTAQ